MREWADLDARSVPTLAHTDGWASPYPLLAALETAADGEVTRDALRDAARALSEPDEEGMGSPDPGESPGGVGHRIVRQTMLVQPDPDAAAGLRVARDFFAGPTAEAHAFSELCA